MVDLGSLEDIEKEIEEIKASLPEHSIPASMLLRLEELEDRLKNLLEDLGEIDASA